MGSPKRSDALVLSLARTGNLFQLALLALKNFDWSALNVREPITFQVFFFKKGLFSFQVYFSMSFSQMWNKSHGSVKYSILHARLEFVVSLWNDSIFFSKYPKGEIMVCSVNSSTGWWHFMGKILQPHVPAKGTSVTINALMLAMALLNPQQTCYFKLCLPKLHRPKNNMWTEDYCWHTSPRTTWPGLKFAEAWNSGRWIIH